MDWKKTVTVKTFSNDTQAHMAQMYLESMGIQSYLKKDDAGGAYPQLQLTTGIQLCVDSKDVQNANSILDEMDKEEVSEKIEAEPPKKSRTWSVFVIGLLLGAFLSSIAFIPYLKDREFAERKVEYDNYSDEKTDMIYYYSRGNLMEIHEDRDYDGQMDIWYYYGSNKINGSESDDNFDGTIDGWSIYKNQNNYQSKLDTDFDGHPDATAFIVSGLAQKIDWHPRNSQIVERREKFHNGVKTEELLDTNKDGKFDIKITYDPFGNEGNRASISDRAELK